MNYWEPTRRAEIVVAPWCVALRFWRVLVYVGLNPRMGLRYRWGYKHPVYTGIFRWSDRGYKGKRLGLGVRWL